ncbi:uncharacterized protein LOC122341315 [Puntigrus tetrazona]|uniref:uncharacterized protein LOC122341315 n=1 Tax=Puntigrus tetrazona TaxID=1606681 RepID=UPI001C8A3FFA|nr:uncharacterized protein LOC122341315 [Puntigrus tetrazona]
MSGASLDMARTQLSALFILGFITLIHGQCQVDFLNGTVFNNGSACAPYSQTVLNNSLACSAIQQSDLSPGNLNNLKAFTDAAFDLYTLLKSKLDASQVVNYINQARTNGSAAGSLSDVNFAGLWFQVKLNPYLSSLSGDTLSCLSQSGLVCQSFQDIVKGLSSRIGPERQRMVYQNFIKPFLARNTTEAGCVVSNTSEWLLLNFQTFSASASLEDFLALNTNFDGLLVLDKLTPEQKAQLLFKLEASANLNIDALTQIFQSFVEPLANVKLNMTSTTSNGLDQSLSDFLLSLRPLGRFIRACVNLSQNTTASSIRNGTIQLLVNWTLSFDSQISINTFSISNFTDWLQFVVLPVMKKSLQLNQTLPDVSAIPLSLFAPEPEITEPSDNCKVTRNNSSCLTSQIADNLAKTINCVAQTNLSFTEENLKLLITDLSRTLQTLMDQSRVVTNSSQSNLTAVFAELPAESFTSGNLNDAEFTSFWFQIKMKPLLPQIPREFLSCINTRAFSCQAYRALFGELNNNFGLMDSATQRFVFSDFIRPFLSRLQNTGIDCTLPFNNSVDFILQNFGSFSPLARLQDFSSFSRNFSAVDAVSVLTMRQLEELVFSPPAKPEDRGNILTKVFDFLLKDSNRDKLNNFLPSLQAQARKANFNCSDYKVIFDRMDQTLSSVAPNQSEALLTIRDSVMMIPPDECIERTIQCTTTPVNESVLCASVNSSAVDQFLNGLTPNTPGLCNFTVVQFACLPTLSQLNSQQVADLLACKLSSNVTKETWKLFFIKTSTNLDDALLKFSNKTPSVSNVSLSDVLDVIDDIRISRFSPQRLKDPVFIQSWFQGRLNPFLPSISQRLLSCLGTRNFTCESYRTIYSDLNNNFGLMNSATQRFVLSDFIRPFLSQRQNTGIDCTLPFNNSVDFILQNFGSFSPLARLQDFSSFSRNFSAVDAVSVLTMRQLEELVFSPPAKPEDRGNILTKVFDFLLKDSNRDKLNNFLPSLQAQARKANFNCSDYKVIFDRMDQTLSSVAPNQSEALLTIRDSVMMIPPDECIERTIQCTTTPVNESVLCASVNSSAVDQFLNGLTPNTPGLCNFTVVQFACLPTLSQLNSQQVADLLACKLSSNVTKETWKLFFIKTSTNLDDALLKFSNKTPSVSNVSLSDVLDVIDDIRISRFSPQRLKDPVFIQSWFQGRLNPFLPSISQRLLSCLGTRNFTCESYRTIYSDLNNNFGLMNSATQRFVLSDFIRPFLSQRQNTGIDCTLPFNNSVDFILQNFGSFSPLARLQDFSSFSRNFSAVDAVSVLTMRQLEELVFSPPAKPEDRGNILTKVFDFLLKDSNRDKLNNFLPSLQAQARKANFNCSDYKVIFDRMDQTLSSVAPNQSEALLTIRDSVMMIPPDECIERTIQCTTTPVNESVLCASVNSSAVDQFLNGLTPNTPGLCNFTVVQFACLPTLSQLNSQQVADLLACKLSSNVTKETWKLFFIKTSTNLDDALLKFSNKTPSVSNVSLSDVLDVIDDIRISRFSPQRLKDPVFIQSWFQGRLNPFLPSISQRLLSCLGTRNFTCESYRTIYSDLNNNFGLMNSATQRFVLSDFIRPFLSQRQNTGIDCTLPFNNSVDFILQNFGSFSPLARLQDFSSFSRNFSAVDAVSVLTMRQLEELVFSPPAKPEDRGNILTKVFDFLLKDSNRDKLNNFLPSLQAQARKANFNCSDYKVIFDRMDQTLSSVAPNQSEALLTIRDSVMMIPPDECIERTIQCTTTPVNESVLCASVNSSAVDQFLNGLTPNTPGLCNFTVVQFACLPTLSQLNSQQVADLLACKLSSNVTKETWKLFFIKTSTNLDDALLKFSNKTPSVSNVSLSDVLDVIDDIRISRFSPQRLKDPVFIQSWFQGRLNPFLPSISQRLLSCLGTRNFTCESYRTIYSDLNNNFGLMNSATQRFVLSDFIRPFLSQRQNTGIDCTLPFNNSVDFILQNFGSFSPLARLQDFSSFSRNFSAVDAVSVLTMRQLEELVFSPPAKPEDRGNILTKVFDFLLKDSNRDKLNNFLPSLQAQARKANFNCSDYKVIFDRMDQTLSSVAPNQSEALLTIRDSVMMIPPDECIERTIQCTTTPVNESVLCASVNSSAVDQFLNGLTPNTPGLCNFTVVQFACLPTLSQLNSQQVADLLACKLSSNVTKKKPGSFSSSKPTPSVSNVSLSDVLDVIDDIRISRFSPQRLKDPVFIQSWFQGRLNPFLPSISQRLLSCLGTRNFTCESYRTM